MAPKPRANKVNYVVDESDEETQLEEMIAPPEPMLENQRGNLPELPKLQEMLDLLMHASQCRSANCQYLNCRKVKGLFRHGKQCKTRTSGGCVLCKKMWELIQLHAHNCKEFQCHVPRCRDLKERMRKSSCDGNDEAASC